MKRLEIILFAIILLFSVRPVENYDVWFHLKYGEYILTTKQLPFTDVFSHTAFGQPAVPYEWLFQLILYFIYRAFGTAGIQILVASLVLGYTLLFRQILKEIFSVPTIGRMFLVAFAFVLGYDFWVERPQSAAYLIFMATTYIILKRVFLGKNWLWLSVPLFLLWTNSHASMILGLYLFFSFAAITFIRKDLHAARDLFLFGAINAAITILPPLGSKVYQLLFLFYEKREFISLVIGEWVPLYLLSVRYYLYLVVMGIAGISLFWARPFLYFVPFIPLGLFVITGVRQTPFSMPVILLCMVPAVTRIKFHPVKRIQVSVALGIVISATIALFFYRREATGIVRDYPKQAIPFIKNNIRGNMFNRYSMGGYLMYHLGPEFKTFIDGRTDMFLPKVLPQYDQLLNEIDTDEEFKENFDELVDMYHVSWAILTTERLTPMRRLARLIRSDPSWYLIFFDDTAEIYIKDDGVNDDVKEKFWARAATPFAASLYKTGQKDHAREEYDRMYKISPSAVSANALGYMLLEEEKYDQAKVIFEEALVINPKAASPKMNLAELAAYDGNTQMAINLYRQAIGDDPTRGLAYLRLGQILASVDKKNEAIAIWQKGLAATPDQEILQKIRQALADSTD